MNATHAASASAVKKTAVKDLYATNAVIAKCPDVVMKIVYAAMSPVAQERYAIIAIHATDVTVNVSVAKPVRTIHVHVIMASVLLQNAPVAAVSATHADNANAAQSPTVTV